MKRDSRLYFPEVIKNTYLARGNVIFQVSLTFSTGMDIHSLTITMDWQNGVIVDETLDNSVAEIDHKDNVDEIQVNFESQTHPRRLDRCTYMTLKMNCYVPGQI